MGYRAAGRRKLEAHDIAVLVMMIKISRVMWTPAKRDSWVDIAGYAACGLECAIHEDEERMAVVNNIEDAKKEFKTATADPDAKVWEYLDDWTYAA
jgi:hypothetical protein